MRTEFWVRLKDGDNGNEGSGDNNTDRSTIGRER